MCEQCIAKTRSFRPRIVPGVRLVQATEDGSEMKTGDYGLVFINNPSFIFKITPEADPTNGQSDEEMDMDAFFAWDEKANIFREEIYTSAESLEASYDLIEACILAGYIRLSSGFVSHWLFNRIGQLLPTGTWVEHNQAWPEGLE